MAEGGVLGELYGQETATMAERPRGVRAGGRSCGDGMAHTCSTEAGPASSTNKGSSTCKS